MIARSKPNVDYNFLWECICGKGQQIDNTISKSFFFNSGASSLLFFLNLFGTKKRVGLQVFTCSTVLDVIQMAEDRVVLMDIDKDYFTTTYDIVEKHIDSIDILILSHLFGIPNPDYLRIKQLCQLRGVVLIDDLCQTFHAKIGGYFLEDLSDNYFYSFFYDKPISATSGGMLKLSDDLYTKAFDVYNALEKESDSRGKLLLRKLFWMSYLLEPQYYKYDFRNNSLWNEVLLGYYPLSCPLLLLRALLYSIVGRVFCKLHLVVKHEYKIKRMSDLQKQYVLHMIDRFNNNNKNLIAYCRKNHLHLPLYMCNSLIECSLAKRGILHDGPTINKENVEVALYNWPYLIDSDNNYPIADSVIKEYVNIPIWSDEF